jgi:O-antigen/teichoic acid export membrane protein
VCTLIAIPTVLHFGGRLPALVLSSLGILVLANLASTAIWSLRARGNSLPPASHPTAADLGKLFKAGTLFLAVQLASAFAFQSDAIVITQMLGQAPYGDYAAVQRLYVFASMLISAALAGLWPAFGDALARGEVAWVRHALRRALGMTLLVMGSLCLVLALSMGMITKLWLGTEHAPSLLLTSLLSLWALLEALGMVAASLLNGAGVLRAQAALALVMAGTSFGAKWALVGWVGVEGAVLATIIAYCCISVPAQIVLVRRLFRDAIQKSQAPAVDARGPEDSSGEKQT